MREGTAFALAGSVVLSATALLLSWATQPPPQFVGYKCRDAWGPQHAQTRAELSHCGEVEPTAK